jgi:hypothetical protein
MAPVCGLNPTGRLIYRGPSGSRSAQLIVPSASAWLDDAGSGTSFDAISPTRRLDNIARLIDRARVSAVPLAPRVGLTNPADVDPSARGGCASPCATTLVVAHGEVTNPIALSDRQPQVRAALCAVACPDPHDVQARGLFV